MASSPNPNRRYGIVSRRIQKRDRIQQIHLSLQRGIIPVDIKNNTLLHELKYHLSEQEVNIILDQLDDERFNLVIGNPIAEKYEELAQHNIFLNDYDIEKEVKWISRFLKDYNVELQSFLRLETLYEKELFSGNYEKASELIEQIESEITVSAWSIQQKLVIAEFNKGFKANKDVLTDVLEKNVVAIVGFIASYTSIRIEKNISEPQYTKLVDDYIKVLANPKLVEYVYFKIDFFREYSIKDFTTMLVYDGALSIIDRYKIFIQVAQYIFAKNEVSERLTRLFYVALTDLQKFIIDYRIDNLLTIYDGETRYSSNMSFLEMIDAYTACEYEKVLEVGRSYLEQNPSSFKAISIYCKTLCILGREHEIIGTHDSILNETIGLVISLYIRDKNYSDFVYSDLYKIATFFGNHSFALGIFDFLWTELPFQVPVSDDINFSCLSVLSGNEFNPAIHQFIFAKKRSVFLSKVQRDLNTSATIRLITLLTAEQRKKNWELEHLDFRSLKYLALLLRSNGRSIESLRVIDYIFTSLRFDSNLENPYLYMEIMVEKYNALLQDERWIEAADLACSTIIKHPNFIDKFFNPFLLEKLAVDPVSELQSNISVPIYLKFFEDKIDAYYLYVAYDNYLYSKGCETPKDYFTQFNASDILDVTFLERVCKHEVLYSSPYFNDQEEMDLARIEICNFLSDQILDYNPFESEISELLRKVLVRKGIKQIDYSKIYVDIKGLKESITKELKENFNRNVEIASLPANQLSKIMDSLGNVLVYYVEDPESEEQILTDQTDEQLLGKLKLTSYNRFLLFSESFLKIRDMFLFNTDCGLDTYLSMRIRHGTLPGQIRSIFELDKLVTSWDETDNEYLPNEYWLGKFPNLDESEKNKLSKVFNLFSGALDKVTENLKSQIIQIKTETKMSRGMFDYSYNESELLDLFSQRFGPIRDFDQFVTAVFQTLWERTELLLEEIRRYMSHEFTEQVNQVFERFDKELNQVSGFREHAYESQELLSTIGNARTSIVVEIQRIADWFRRSNKKYIEEFDFDILLNASVITLRRSFMDATINIENSCDIKIDGDYFPYFTDIFIYLLHNALKHSKLPNSGLRILIRVGIEGNRIIINLENNVLNDSEYIAKLQARISRSLATLSDPAKSGLAISKEGGTGYPKIQKALTSDLKRKHCDINFGLSIDSDETLFKSSISFEFADLQKINEV